MEFWSNHLIFSGNSETTRSANQVMDSGAQGPSQSHAPTTGDASALVNGSTTSEAIIPRSRFHVDEDGQFNFIFDVREYKREELNVSFEN